MLLGNKEDNDIDNIIENTLLASPSQPAQQTPNSGCSRSIITSKLVSIQKIYQIENPSSTIIKKIRSKLSKSKIEKPQLWIFLYC